MSAQYNFERRVPKTPAVERVAQFDSTARLDLGRQKKFEAALSKAADSVRLQQQRLEHRTYAEADLRQASAKKKP